MDPRRIRPGRGNASQFVQPLLNTLNTMRGAERLRPDQLNARAEQLLWDQLGTEGGAAETAYAHGAVDLVAEHTRYFDGFALLVPVHEGCSVAVRAGTHASHRVALEVTDPALEALLLELIGLVAGESRVDLAVSCNLPGFLPEARRAPALVAAARALSALFSRETDGMDWLADLKGPDRFTRSARIMACSRTAVSSFVLADTREKESIALEVPPMERPALALLAPPEAGAMVRGDNRKLTREATRALQEAAMPGIQSIRDVEHRDLRRALESIDRKLRPLVTYLVTENGRVQRLVAAIQRRDWQMFGALLLMSHSSKRQDLGLEDAEVDAIVEDVENMSLDGMYGATRLNADSRAILVAGQQFSVPPALEKLTASFAERTDSTLSTIYL
ncbi:MAG: hypothetical protein JJ896_02255 [Rhodothermales bacterium]|nr:hypothetical protein [Rhodothermales bacterium]MBO6778452.1 hypothetical protein [Rhodothermales bacterium]